MIRVPVQPAARAVLICSPTNEAAPRALFAVPPRSPVPQIIGAASGVEITPISGFSPIGLRARTEIAPGRRYRAGSGSCWCPRVRCGDRAACAGPSSSAGRGPTSARLGCGAPVWIGTGFMPPPCESGRMA
jgi:hypothetical protein